MSSFLVPGLHIGQAMLSAYTGLLSYSSIVKLQTYEEKSKKAAEYSNTAEHQLHKTRTTQASGALTTLFSLVSSIGLLVIGSSPDKKPLFALICLANTVGLTLAHTHVSNFWRNKAKVPFVQNFNDAISTSNQMRSSLARLGMLWAVATVIYGYNAIGK